MARIGVCHVREGRSIFPNLTVRDNLTVAASASILSAGIEEIAYPCSPGWRSVASNRPKTSRAARSRCWPGPWLGTEPSVLLVDELSMGLAPIIVGELYESVVEVARSGVSVLIVEQFASIGLRAADHVHVMAHGTVTYSVRPTGPPRPSTLRTSGAA